MNKHQNTVEYITSKSLLFISSNKILEVSFSRRSDISVFNFTSNAFQAHSVQGRESGIA